MQLFSSNEKDQINCLVLVPPGRLLDSNDLKSRMKLFSIIVFNKVISQLYHHDYI